MSEKYSEEELREAYFIQLIYTFQAAAMQQMGKIVNPITNQVEKNMEQAEHSIDMLAMLETKTSGNLNEREKKILEKTLFELRMNYVDEMKITEEEKEDRSQEGQRSVEDKEKTGSEKEEPESKEPSAKESSTKEQTAGQKAQEEPSGPKEAP